MPGDNEKEWKVKDLALHRMKGFPIWPVQVLDPKGKYEHDLPPPAKGQASSMLPVYYFNSKNYGWVKPSELQDLDEKPAKMKGGQAEAFSLAKKAQDGGPVADPLAAFLEQKGAKKRKPATPAKPAAEKKVKVETKKESAEKNGSAGKKHTEKKPKTEPTNESDLEGSSYDAQAEANKLLEKEKAEQRKRERELEIEREFEEDIADLIEGSDDDESNEKPKKKKKKEKKDKKDKKGRKKSEEAAGKRGSNARDSSVEDDSEEVVHHHHSKKSSRSPKKSRRIDDDDDDDDDEDEKKEKTADKEKQREKEKKKDEKKRKEVEKKKNDEKKKRDAVEEVASTRKVEALIAVIKKAEGDLDHGPNADECIESLRKLRALSNMTVDILTETGVGKVIHKLGKKDGAPERVIKYSKALVKDWKQLIAPK